MLTGVDVSRWQGVINWSLVANSIDFAIIKIGGSDDGFYIDSQANRNVLEARSHNIPHAFYFYLGGVYSPSEEANQIKNIVNQLGGLRSGEFVCLDWEERRAGHDEVGYLNGIVDNLSSAGFPPPMIYMNLHYVKSQDWSSLVRKNCSLWVAAWGNNDAIPQPHEVPGSDEWPFWAVWQYSSNGIIPGINSRVDLNKFNGDRDAFSKYGLGAGSKVTPPVTDNQSFISGDFAEYSVQPGDTLSGIASQFGKSWQDLWSINSDKVSDPHKIFPGQLLRVWKNPQQPTTTHTPQQRTYTVVPNDNLSIIAGRYGLTWQQIYNANVNVIGNNPNLIKPGQILVIP